MITYYKKIHDLTAFDPIIDNDLQDSFKFESRNGETNIILTEKIFIRFLLKKYDYQTFEQYLEKLLAQSSPENKFYKIADKLGQEFKFFIDNIDYQLLDGLDYTFTMLSKSFHDLFTIETIIKKLQAQTQLIDQELSSYNKFKDMLSVIDAKIIEDSLSNGQIKFETINKYIPSKWQITDKVKEAIEFYIENPEYKSPGYFLLQMIQDNKVELLKAIISNNILKKSILDLKESFIPNYLKDPLESLFKEIESYQPIQVDDQSAKALDRNEGGDLLANKAVYGLGNNAAKFEEKEEKLKEVMLDCVLDNSSTSASGSDSLLSNPALDPLKCQPFWSRE